MKILTTTGSKKFAESNNYRGLPETCKECQFEGGEHSQVCSRYEEKKYCGDSGPCFCKGKLCKGQKSSANNNQIGSKLAVKPIEDGCEEKIRDMTLHDIIQKNMETLKEKYCRKNGQTGVFEPNWFIKNGDCLKYKDFEQDSLSSQLSIIQAIDEWAESKKVKDVNECENMNSGEIRNKTLSELHSFLNNAKTKLQ